MILVTKSCDNCKRPIEVFEKEIKDGKKIICLECLKKMSKK